MVLFSRYNTMKYHDMHRILFMIVSPYYKNILETHMVTDICRNTQYILELPQGPVAQSLAESQGQALSRFIFCPFKLQWVCWVSISSMKKLKISDSMTIQT